MWNRTPIEHDFVANTPQTLVPTPDRVVELDVWATRLLSSRFTSTLPLPDCST